ncbi:TetR family transcriptional regulator [Sphingomonas oleivorans]|uniref:TetR family transcriptional regulator n=1 Tax=Sphingomonas oleivorans TaxID=1735121 RepID=A0A2T5G2B8_9SPHN|nr:TetR/AcrR family transcriptional regulator [Sphingomonas oleivorans]PTQ13278.1 TetR family transcriptional regulator [Sphingomonas oleivorans]
MMQPQQPELHERWLAADGHDAARAVLRDAAHALLREGGPQGFSMRELATCLGISAMTPYRYYPSKEALFVDLRAGIFGRFTTMLREAAAGGEGPRERFRLAARAYFAFAREHEQDYRLIFDLMPRASPPPGRAEPHATPSWDQLIALVAALSEQPDPAAVQLGAHFAWATLHGLAMLHLSNKLTLGIGLEQLIEPSIEMLILAIEQRLERAACP